MCLAFEATANPPLGTCIHASSSSSVRVSGKCVRLLSDRRHLRDIPAY